MFDRTPTPRFVGLVLVVLCFTGGLDAEAQGTDGDTSLTQVESHYVCMVTDRHFSQKQIPVPTNDRTYYGCCQGCVNRLNKDPAIRDAIDPISQDTVDKATAVIGVDSEGQAYYFESEANLRRFNPEAHNADDVNTQESPNM